MPKACKSDLGELARALRQTRNASLEAALLFRLCCTALVLSGCPPAQVGDWLGVSGRSVARWVACYRRGGAQALRQGLRGGRPAQLAPDVAERLAVDLRAPPERLGLPGSDWTGPVLRRWLRDHYGIALGLRQCQRLLARRWDG